MRIYIRHQDLQLGPYTEAEVRAKFACGALSIEDRVWWQGQADWIPLGESPLPLTCPPRAAGTMPELRDPADWRFEDKGPTGPTTPNVAIGSLTCGCFALLFGFFTSIPAIILGHLALREIRKTPDRPGRGMAMGGLVMGYLLTTLSIALTTFYLHKMSDHPQLGHEAQSTALVSSDLSQPPAPISPPAAGQAPVSDEILYQPPPVDYSAVPTTSFSNADSMKAPDASTNAAPAPGR